MSLDSDYDRLKKFIQDRIDESRALPGLEIAARQILAMAILSEDADYPDYAVGYADAAEDALNAISGVWRYHPDYEGWAEDE